MRFILNGKAASQSLTKLRRLVGKDITHFIIQASAKRQKIMLHGYGLQRRVVIRLPGSVSASGKFAIEQDRFTGLVKNRGDIDFSVNDNHLAFQQSNSSYRGDRITLLPWQQVRLISPDIEHSIPSHIQAKLLPALRACLISSVFGGQQLGVSIMLRDRQLLVITADSYHAAIAQFTIRGSEARALQANGLAEPINLPLEYAELLVSQFDKAGLMLKVNNRQVIIANDEIYVELPTMQSNTSMTQRALQLAGSEYSPPLILSAAEKLLEAMNNLKVIGKAELPLKIISHQGEKYIDLRYKSPSGQMADRLALNNSCSRDGKINAEPNNLFDIARKISKNAELSFNRQIIRLHCQPAEELQVDYYSSQLQEPKRVG